MTRAMHIAGIRGIVCGLALAVYHLSRTGQFQDRMCLRDPAL